MLHPPNQLPFQTRTKNASPDVNLTARLTEPPFASSSPRQTGQRGASQKPTVSARAVLPHPSGFEGPGAQVWPLPRESRCARAPGWGGVHAARRPAVTRVSLGVAGAFPLPLPPISRTVTSWPRSSFRVALYSPRSFLDNCKRITCVGKTPPWREARHGQTRLLRGQQRRAGSAQPPARTPRGPDAPWVSAARRCPSPGRAGSRSRTERRPSAT